MCLKLIFEKHEQIENILQQQLNIIINEIGKCKITLNFTFDIDVKTENKPPGLDGVDHKDSFRMIQKQEGQLEDDDMI